MLHAVVKSYMPNQKKMLKRKKGLCGIKQRYGARNKIKGEKLQAVLPTTRQYSKFERKYNQQ